MNPGDLASFAALLKARSGIEIDAQKAYLVQSRLGPVALATGHRDVDALLAALRAGPSMSLAEAAVDAMTTNETFFFRDPGAWEHLRRILMHQAQGRGPGPIRLWSAACSTGQEPYSVAMLWDEIGAQRGGRGLEILASDISSACLEKATAGVYTAFEIQRGLPPQKLVRHFDQDGPNWRAKAALRASVAWRKLNLLERFDGLGAFDVVLCRNVLIYFDRPTRSRILEGVARVLAPGGYLLLGGAETVVGLTQALEPAQGVPGLYVRSSPAGDVRPAGPVAQPLMAGQVRQGRATGAL